MFAKGALISLFLATGVISAPKARQLPQCPEVWNYIAKELKYEFIDNQGFCTNYARQAIRLPFHDCFPEGGCDGSIVLTDECFTRFENERLIPICSKLRDIAVRYDVSVADLINLAGCEYKTQLLSWPTPINE
jgi:manganese peroxidase